MRKILLSVATLVVALIVILLLNTFRFTSRQDATLSAQPAPPLSDAAIAHFSSMLQYKTISHADTALFDSTQFTRLRQFLETSYPLVHQHLQREIINRYSLLYHWQGTDTSLLPAILMAHMDVVPVEEESSAPWKTDPFAGTVQDGYIYGRGAIDDKVNMASILESAEKLLQQGFQPRRSVYFVFGHDEEQGGLGGAKQVAAFLEKQKVQAEWVLDEGGLITQEKVPGIKKPVALLATAEKGYLTLLLEVNHPGGHSAMPAKETAVDILTKGLVRIQEHPFTTRLSPSQQAFIQHIGPEMPFMTKMAFANTWLTEKMIIGQYTKTPVGNAMMRTTSAATILQAGIKENIVPGSASAVINLRLLPGDSVAQVIDRIRAILEDDRVTMQIMQAREASAVTDAESRGFQQVARAVRKTFPETVVAPVLCIGGTDSKHFQQLSKSIIRFIPVMDPEGYHGVNERISLDAYRKTLWFYEQLMRDL